MIQIETSNRIVTIRVDEEGLDALEAMILKARMDNISSMSEPNKSTPDGGALLINVYPSEDMRKLIYG